LGEQDLPISTAQGGHEHAHHFQRRASNEDQVKAAGIEESAGEDADDHGQEELDGSNP